MANQIPTQQEQDGMTMGIWTLHRKDASIFSFGWDCTTPDRPVHNLGGLPGLVPPAQRAGDSYGQKGLCTSLGGGPVIYILGPKSLLTVIHSIVASHLDYCNPAS